MRSPHQCCWRGPSPRLRGGRKKKADQRKRRRRMDGPSDGQTLIYAWTHLDSSRIFLNFLELTQILLNFFEFAVFSFVSSLPFQSRTRDSISHSVGQLVRPSVCRSVPVYFFFPKGDLTSITAPAQRTRQMLSCKRPCSTSGPPQVWCVYNFRL